MGHKNIYDVLKDIGLRPAIEYKRLMFLFFRDQSIMYYDSWISLADLIRKTYFYSAKIRGTATNITELFLDLNLSDSSSRIDDLFLLCELILAFDPHCHNIDEVDDNILIDAYNQFDKIKNNIETICRHSNHEIFNNKGKPIIVEKNKLTSHAVELTDDSALALSMIEYNHYALKGHLENKKKILFQIGSIIEPIIKEHRLKNAGFGNLESDAGYLLKIFNIRHNNKEGKKANDYIVSLSEEELEDWYDKTYTTLLSVIIINEQIGISEELKKIKEMQS